MSTKITYASAGVHIATADKAKEAMAKDLSTDNPLVLNTVGAFASLCDGSFPGIKHPVLVCKTEEPGTKQLLAFQYNRLESICQDLINHLINDVIVMGATPLFIQDLIVCGKLEPEVVQQLVKHMASACKAQGCALTGGETSEQPSVLAEGTYVLGASCIGVAEKAHVIDGSAIQSGDVVIALESSGPHTNGYTLLRALIKQDPTVIDVMIADRGKPFEALRPSGPNGNTAPKKFLDLIMEPHRCYFLALKDLFASGKLHGMAHITGGGIPGNLNRILPKNMNAMIDAEKIAVLPVFSFIKDRSQNDDDDMIRTFNLGVGATVVVAPDDADDVIAHLATHDQKAYVIGKIESNGTGVVQMMGSLRW